MKKSVYIFLVLLWVMPVVSAQDISAHQWENRVLIVMAANKDSELLQQQIKIFNQDAAGLTERKLLIFLMTLNEIATYNPQEIEWKPFTAPFDSDQLGDSEIEHVLFGLDGQIKYKTYSLTPALEIFAIIDGMPMRQTELRNSNRQH